MRREHLRCLLFGPCWFYHLSWRGVESAPHRECVRCGAEEVELPSTVAVDFLRDLTPVTKQVFDGLQQAMMVTPAFP